MLCYIGFSDLYCHPPSQEWGLELHNAVWEKLHIPRRMLVSAWLLESHGHKVTIILSKAALFLLFWEILMPFLVGYLKFTWGKQNGIMANRHIKCYLWRPKVNLFYSESICGSLKCSSSASTTLHKHGNAWYAIKI